MYNRKFRYLAAVSASVTSLLLSSCIVRDGRIEMIDDTSVVTYPHSEASSEALPEVSTQSATSDTSDVPTMEASSDDASVTSSVESTTYPERDEFPVYPKISDIEAFKGEFKAGKKFTRDMVKVMAFGSDGYNKTFEGKWWDWFGEGITSDGKYLVLHEGLNEVTIVIYYNVLVDPEHDRVTTKKLQTERTFEIFVPYENESTAEEETSTVDIETSEAVAVEPTQEATTAEAETTKAAEKPSQPQALGPTQPTTPEATTPKPTEPTAPEATTPEPTTPEPTTPEPTTPEPTTPEPTTTAHEHSWVATNVKVKDAWDEVIVDTPEKQEIWVTLYCNTDGSYEEATVPGGTLAEGYYTVDELNALGINWTRVYFKDGDISDHAQVQSIPTGMSYSEYVYPDRYLRTAKTEAHSVCWGCRFDFTAAGYTPEQVGEHQDIHMDAGEDAGFGTASVIVGYNVSKLSFSYSASDCEVTTIPAVTHSVHHDAEYKTVYICSGCGEEKK